VVGAHHLQHGVAPENRTCHDQALAVGINAEVRTVRTQCGLQPKRQSRPDFDPQRGFSQEKDARVDVSTEMLERGGEGVGLRASQEGIVNDVDRIRAVGNGLGTAVADLASE
jgi:hypothetical protein